MTLSEIIVNMERTIAGKESALEGYRRGFRYFEENDDQCDAWMVLKLQIEYLTINIEELQRILVDLKEIK